ncbi:MAG: FecR family protein [Treponema sp.]|nr:FecR family protein [Treponema sp.]
MNRKSRRNGWSITAADGIVVVLCLGGAFFCLRSFWADFNQTLSQQNAAPLGTISWKYKAAQRRFTDRALWDRLQRESPIYNGDYVRTAELSEATVTFTGGIVIDLAENSLIQIFRENAVSRLDLTQGGVSVDTAVSWGSEPLILNAGDRTISAGEGAVFDTRIDNDGNFSLRLAEGSAEFSQKGETRELTAGQALIQDPQGRALEIPQTVMLSPKPVARLLHSADSLAVGFYWNAQNYGEGDRTRIEIALDRSFRRILHVLDRGRQTDVSVDLANGVYFWRAYPAKDAADTADADAGADLAARAALASTGKLTILSLPVPRTLSPEEGRVYRYRSKTPSILFEWTASPEVSFYMLEAADNPGMAKPALQTLARGGSGSALSLAYSGLGEGNWFWRVSPVFTDEYQGTVAPSAAASFVIAKSGTLEAPVLLTPLPEAILNAAAADRQDIYFSWQNEAEADSYTLLIAASADLRNPLVERQTRDNHAVYGASESLLGEGRYYWGVRQTDSEGTVSAASPSRAFAAVSGDLVLRPLFPPDNYTVNKADLPGIRFAWRTNLPGPLYFQVSASADFSAPAINEIAAAGEFTGGALDDGTWHWRVVSQSGGARAQTQTRSFRVVSPEEPPPDPEPPPVAIPVAAPVLREPPPPPLLPEPVGRLPANGHSIGPEQLREFRTIYFSWEAVDGADSYIFSLYKAEGGERRFIQRWASTRNSHALNDLSLLENGRFIWTVEAINQGSGGPVRRGRTGENSFTVDIPPIRRQIANNPGSVYGR